MIDYKYLKACLWVVVLRKNAGILDGKVEIPRHCIVKDIAYYIRLRLA